MESDMGSSRQDGERQFTTPRWVQIWFLRRSRGRWKQKYKQLKADAKRLQNRVNDVTRSRDRWREQAERQGQRVRELEAEHAPEQAALKKKCGRPDVAVVR